MTTELAFICGSPTNRQSNTSVPLVNMRAFESESLRSQPLNVLRSGRKAALGHRSQTEFAQCALDRSDAHIERLQSLILKCNQLATSLNKDQTLSPLEKRLM